jgi:hypothetical protein
MGSVLESVHLAPALRFEHASQQALVLNENRAKDLCRQFIVEAHHPAAFREDECDGPRERNLLVDRPRRQEIAGQAIDDKLKDTLWALKILEPLLTQIPHGDARQVLVIDDPGRRAREEHLTAVRNRADSRGAVNTDADVAPMGPMWLASMETHSHAHGGSIPPGVRCERALSSGCRPDGVSCAAEDNEKGVSLRIDLDPVVLLEALTKKSAMLGEDVPVIFSQPFDELG